MNIGKLVLRKPDDRAPADSSTLPKALDHRPAPPRIAGDVNSKAVTCDRLPKLAQRGEGGGAESEGVDILGYELGDKP